MKNMDGIPGKKKLSRKQDSTQHQDVNFLVLFNDDHNSFGFVIDALINDCDHDPEQAEQCAFITHYKGKCDIKKGSMNHLKPIYDRLLRKDLTVTIE